MAEPPLETWVDVLAANRAHLESIADLDWQGRKLGRIRTMARAEVLAAARAHQRRHHLPPWPASLTPEAPLIVTGHQPELFHPGVWIKNAAIAALARRVGGLGLNLIVDNDLLKRAAVRVPRAEGTTTLIPFDDWGGLTPQEDQVVRDEATFELFGARVRAALDGCPKARPLIDEAWPLALKHRADAPQGGLRLALMRRELEQSFGIGNAEVRLGAAEETDGFLWFATHLLAHLPRFHAAYNGALVDHRARNKIRSTHHPVPSLRQDGDWHEAPFWIWRASQPRREPLFARQRDPATVELRIGAAAESILELPLAPDREGCCAVEKLRELAARSIRLRSRALSTTMFARLALGDLFVHGIGGAKYDELGDEVTRRFFGVEPPPFAVLTMTMRLGMSTVGGASERGRDLGRLARDLQYNPDRHLPGGEISAEVAELVAAKQRAIGASQATRSDRVARFAEIRRINQALQASVAIETASVAERRERARSDAERDRIATGREYAFVLHDRGRMAEAFARVARAIGA